jgi:hypothetical protein
MKTETHDIDVNKAKEFLEKNREYVRGEDGTNRPISLRTVNRYAIQMLRGLWRPTHQGIGFSTKGWLKDGQHRLLAIVQAAEVGAIDGDETLVANPKIKVKMQVTFGLDDDVFEVLDTGLPRTANQILAIAGYSGQIALAASARLLFLYDNYEYSLWRRTKVSNHDVLSTVRQTSIDQYIPEVSPMVPVGFLIPPTVVGYYVCERAFPSGPMDEFIVGLNTGEDMKVDDPRMTLRNYMIRSKGGTKTRRDASSHLALFIIAWNDFVAGKKRSQISWRPSSQDFPKPVEGQ